MKHSGEGRESVERVLEWLEGRFSLQNQQWAQLESFAQWLNQEAMVAGGIGPRESKRIWERHLADSLVFACGWLHSGPPPRLLDVGSGVGLPGIPLAILWPSSQVTLLDRSGRRVDLARRAVRSLRLDNVDIHQGDALSEPAVWDAVVFRAVFSPERACQTADRLLYRNGTAVVGLRGASAVPPAGGTTRGQRDLKIIEIPATVLDGTVSLLIMGPSGH